MANNVAEVILRVVDQASAAIQQVEATTRGLNAAAEGAVGALRGLSAAMEAARGVAGMLAVSYASGIVRSLQDMALEAASAAASLAVLEKTAARAGVDYAQLEQALRNVLEPLGILPEQAASAAAQLLRAGYTTEQIVAAFQAGAASALAAGETAVQGIENVAMALATGQSIYLNYIGIAENIGPVLQRVESSMRGASKEAIQQAKNTAALNIILRATQEEVRALPDLLSGLAGAQTVLSAETQRLRVEMGRALIPVFTAATSALTGVVRAFNSLSAETRQAIATAGLATGGLGVLAGALAAIRAGVIALLPALASLGSALRAMVLTPVGLAVSAVAALTAAWVKSASSSEEAARRMQLVGQVLHGIGQLALGTAQAIGGLFVSIARSIGGSFQALLMALRGDLAGAWEQLKRTFNLEAFARDFEAANRSLAEGAARIWAAFRGEVIRTQQETAARAIQFPSITIPAPTIPQVEEKAKAKARKTVADIYTATAEEIRRQAERLRIIIPAEVDANPERLRQWGERLTQWRDTLQRQLVEWARQGVDSGALGELERGIAIINTLLEILAQRAQTAASSTEALWQQWRAGERGAVDELATAVQTASALAEAIPAQVRLGLADATESLRLLEEEMARLRELPPLARSQEEIVAVDRALRDLQSALQEVTRLQEAQRAAVDAATAAWIVQERTLERVHDPLREVVEEAQWLAETFPLQVQFGQVEGADALYRIATLLERLRELGRETASPLDLAEIARAVSALEQAQARVERLLEATVGLQEVAEGYADSLEVAAQAYMLMEKGYTHLLDTAGRPGVPEPVPIPDLLRRIADPRQLVAQAVEVAQDAAENAQQAIWRAVQDTLSGRALEIEVGVALGRISKEEAAQALGELVAGIREAVESAAAEIPATIVRDLLQVEQAALRLRESLAGSTEPWRQWGQFIRDIRAGLEAALTAGTMTAQEVATSLERVIASYRAMVAEAYRAGELTGATYLEALQGLQALEEFVAGLRQQSVEALPAIRELMAAVTPAQEPRLVQLLRQELERIERLPLSERVEELSRLQELVARATDALWDMAASVQGVDDNAVVLLGHLHDIGGAIDQAAERARQAGLDEVMQGWADGAEVVLGALDRIVGALEGGSFGRALSGFASAIGGLVSTFVPGGAGLGRVIPVIGDIIEGIFDFFGRLLDPLGPFRKQIQEVAKQFSIISAEAFQGAMEVFHGAHLLDIMTGRVQEEFARRLDLLRVVAGALEGGVIAGVQRAARAFMEGVQDWVEVLRTGIRDAIANAVIEAVVRGAIVKGALGKLLDQLTDAIGRGAYSQARAVAERIMATVPELASQLEAVLAPFRGFLGGEGTSAKQPPQANKQPSSVEQEVNLTYQPPVVSFAMVSIADVFGRYVDAFGGHVYTFGGYVGELVERGITVRVDLGSPLPSDWR